MDGSRIRPGHKQLCRPRRTEADRAAVDILAPNQFGVRSAIDVARTSVWIVLDLQLARSAAASSEVAAHRGERADDRFGRAVETKRAERAFALIEARWHVVEHPLGAARRVLGQESQPDGRLVDSALVRIYGVARIAELAPYDGLTWMGALDLRQEGQICAYRGAARGRVAVQALEIQRVIGRQ